MYNEVLQAVKEWLDRVPEKYGDKVKIEIVKDTPDILLSNIDADHYIGEITVERSGFNPYRYVAFYVLDVYKDTKQTPAFAFCDEENDSVSDVINDLDRGIDFIVSEN